MTEDTPQNQEFSEDFLFKLTIKKKWDEVVEIYQKHPLSHKTKLTKSEETALHIYSSSYHSKYLNHSKKIEQMIDCIKQSDSLNEVLSMPNVQGDTPLHLAAAVGWEAVCKCIASENRQLIGLRNLMGETPLFIAADHGKLQTFLCLHELYNQGDEADESLCRRADGNTILHSAISGEHFRLAYQIISYYPKLINSVNVEGESPLHVLARKPNVFRSSYSYTLFDLIIYHCVSVDELRKEKYNPRATHGPSREILNVPGKYRTCVDIFFFLWKPISKSIAGVFPRKEQRAGQTDEENQHGKNITQKEEKSIRNIKLFRFAMSVIRHLPGVGYWIRKIQEIKEQHSHAFQIMSKMIKFESRNKYNANGLRPPDLELFPFLIPDNLPVPSDDEIEALQGTKISNGRTSSTKVYCKHENGKEHHKSGEKATNVSNMDTPFLVAAKTGIPEMVKEIISTYPVAIRDQDSDGKNVLMLAAENRHTRVFDDLIKTNVPEYMFYQLDDEGNSILHLAARFRELESSDDPNAFLLMEQEVKWLEHVKRSVPPLSFARGNIYHETPSMIFTKTHANLVKEGKKWLIKTSESCLVVAALIATVAFTTSTTVPGGLNQETGYPILQNHRAFDIFTITSFIALFLSITALIFFIEIIASRCKEHEFGSNLPRMLFTGVAALVVSTVAMLASFCAGHTFILRERLGPAALKIYKVATVPLILFAITRLPFYCDLLFAFLLSVPLSKVSKLYNRTRPGYQN